LVIDLDLNLNLNLNSASVVSSKLLTILKLGLSSYLQPVLRRLPSG